MILKFLPNKKGGSTKSIDYLLDEKRVQNGTAKILSGSEKDTRDIINSITKKQKVTFGVLSFEEKNILELEKKELMKDFEKTFFAGLNEEQYNILWVQHTDKERLELNFIIPKIELSTGKTFNPYYHGSDFHFADMFQKKCNLKYGYSDPQDPAKQATIQGSKKEINLFADYKKLDKQLHDLLADGVIQDRNELVDLLTENGIKVPKIGENYISVKLPNSRKAKRLKGGIYESKFTSIDELDELVTEQTKRERAFTNRDSETEYREVSRRLEQSISKRAQRNEENYREQFKRSFKTKGTEQKDNSQVQNAIRENKQTIGTNNKASQESKEVGEQEAKSTVKDNGSEVNDRFRETARARVRERKRALETTRTSLYDKHRETRESLFEQARKNVQRDRAYKARRRRYRSKINNSGRIYSGLDKTLRQSFELYSNFLGNFAKESTNISESIRGFERTIQEELELTPENFFDTNSFGYSKDPDKDKESAIEIYSGYLKCKTDEVLEQPLKEILKVKNILDRKEEARREYAERNRARTDEQSFGRHL